MEKEQIKFAFSKVKQDILFLQNGLFDLKREISEIKFLVKKLNEAINNLNITNKPQNNHSNNEFFQQTIQHINPTHTIFPTDNPTVPQEIKGLKSQNFDISTGNKGVPTDRQTDNQTYRQTEKSSFLFNITKNNFPKTPENYPNIEGNIKEASEILNSLDRLKKEIHIKFKQLTNQEMTVFSTIYQLEELNPEKTTYKEVAKTLKLSESSIRDYTQRIINKGVPIKKQKINNKLVLLSISEELKRIATLPTIIKLREL